MGSVMRAVAAVTVSLVLLAGCSNEAPEEPSADKTTASTQQGLDVVELKPGESVEVVLPAWTFTESEPAPVVLTLHSIRYEPSLATEGNSYAIFDMEAENNGTRLADLRSLNFYRWESNDGLVKTDTALFCPGGVDELSGDLQPGQRMRACKQVDVPSEPGYAVFEGEDKIVKIALDPATTIDPSTPPTTETADPDAAPTKSPPAAQSTPDCVTREEFNKVDTGMSRDEVERLFGERVAGGDLGDGTVSYQSCDMNNAAMIAYDASGSVLSFQWTAAG